MQGRRWHRALSLALWAVTVVAALGIGLAGLAKFGRPEMWRPWFEAWGYPGWVMPTVGGIEIVGAIGLLIPRLAPWAAVLLGAVMLGAFFTLRTHPGSPLGWGATPLVYLCILMLVAVMRWRRGIGTRA